MSSDPLAGLADALPEPLPPKPAPKPKPPPKPPKPAAKPEGGAVRKFPQTTARARRFDGERQDLRRDGRGPRDAIKAGDLNGVQDVLARDGALASYQDRQTESMLHLAALFDHASIALALAAHGADPTVTNAAGESALDVAQPSLRSKLTAARGGAAPMPAYLTRFPPRRQEGGFELPR